MLIQSQEARPWLKHVQVYPTKPVSTAEKLFQQERESKQLANFTASAGPESGMAWHAMSKSSSFLHWWDDQASCCVLLHQALICGRGSPASTNSKHMHAR